MTGDALKRGAGVCCDLDDNEILGCLTDAESAECFSNLPNLTIDSTRHIQAYIVVGTQCKHSLGVNVSRLQSVVEIVIHGSPGGSKDMFLRDNLTRLRLVRQVSRKDLPCWHQ